MNKNTEIIIGIVIFIVLLSFIILKVLTGPGSQSPAQNLYENTGGGSSGVTTNTGNTSGVQTGTNMNTYTLAGAGGGTIQTKDFKKDPELAKDPVNAGYYYFGQEFAGQASTSATTTAASKPYVIEYIDQTQFFNIVLMSEPIGDVRRQAEQYLMAHLGISQSQMCKLKFTVTVPYSVNEIYGGDSLGFSFCPGATPL